MNITKRILASLELIYAVCTIQIEGETHFVAATEGYGECLLFSPPDWTASSVWEGPGGTMCLTPLPGRGGALLAIQEFFPIFQSESAGIVYAEPRGSSTEAWHVRRVIDLPFAHRIEIVHIGPVPYLVAASLCEAKDSQDDWSHPGTVYAGPLPRDPSGHWSLDPILSGISKNHGMHATHLDGCKVVLIAGREGIFSIRVPAEPGEEWFWTRLVEHEVSDVHATDIDGDGIPELVAIEPFHGDTFTIYKLLSREWQAIFCMPISFGHVVWAGDVLGAPAMLVGSRSGDEDLSLMRVQSTDPVRIERSVIDRGIAPTQVGVVHRGNVCQIISANRGTGNAVLYELTH